MSFLSRIFGAEPPTSVKAAAAIDRVEAELRDVPARIARARAALELVADMTDEQHAAADAELAAAQRSEARLTAQIEQLRAVRARAEREEAAAALAARAEATQRRVDVGGQNLLREYQKAAAQMVKVATALAEISAEVNATNHAIRFAPRDEPSLQPPPPVLGVAERFLTEPDTVEPDRVVEQEEWVYHDGRRWIGVGVFGEHNGELVPTVAGAEKRIRRTTIPGKTRPGRKGSSPHEALRLPAAQLGADAFWPKGR